jgi:hypothetical protein
MRRNPPMKRHFVAFGALIALALTLLAAPALLVSSVRADDQHASGGKVMTMKGELVDLACYLSKGAKGEGHKKCAQMCAAQGQPIGLLASDGKLYLVLGKHEGTALDDAKKLCGSMVELTGTHIERDGMHAIVLDSVKESKG